ncbi:MAG: restriction endonuclease subunit S [Weeksellaceae bacterium]|nr:restriction endonuclease subunit S [Weeksellaceae bacterium]
MNREEKKIVPQLRFPEFKDNWKTASLKDVSSYFNGKSFEGDVQENGKYELVTLKSIDTDGNLVHSNRYINDDVKTLAKGTLVMILSEQAPGLLGMTAIIPDNNKYVLNQRVAEIRPTDKVVNYFLSMAINRNQSYFSRLGAGMKVQNISKGNVENYELSYPSIAEQKKIANCFSSLDVIINSETEKLALLQDHKKGLLQQLFPVEVETQPKFRFPEFKDDWKIKEVGEIFDVTRGYVLSMSLVSETKTEENKYPVYSSQTKNNGLAGFYNAFLYENAITWTTDGANAGDVNFREGKFYCTNVCGVLLSKNGFANKCVAEIINSVAKKHVSYIGNPKLMNGVMSKIKISIPSLKEQQKIADCLSAADELIEAQAQKIKALQEHKKGLLQQLFPNLNELAI